MTQADYLTQYLAELDQTKYISGVAELKGILPDSYNRFNYGIVLGRKLDDQIMDNVKNGPNQIYYDHYLQVNQELQGLAEKIRTELLKRGLDFHIIPPTLSRKDENEEYRKTLKVHISHKMVATRAGLGWIGKTALFISSRWGPRLRMVSLLTNVPLDGSSDPVNESRCGNCRICVELCPAGAATGHDWHYRMNREDFFNPFKCREKCRELGGKSVFKEASICGICVSVCPVGFRCTS